MIWNIIPGPSAVFLDLSKAFDREWHNGLLYKLECNCICGNLLGIIQGFLHKRKQRVVLNGKSSNWSAVSAGVPQGSVFGPLFFLAYINRAHREKIVRPRPLLWLRMHLPILKQLNMPYF